PTPEFSSEVFFLELAVRPRASLEGDLTTFWGPGQAPGHVDVMTRPMFKAVGLILLGVAIAAVMAAVSAGTVSDGGTSQGLLRQLTFFGTGTLTLLVEFNLADWIFRKANPGKRLAPWLGHALRSPPMTSSAAREEEAGGSENADSDQGEK